MNTPKGFGTKNRPPQFLLIGTGVSPATLAKDPVLQQQHGKLTAKDFVWYQYPLSRLKEFWPMPKTVTLRSVDGREQILYKIPTAYRARFKPGQILKPKSEADLILVGGLAQ